MSTMILSPAPAPSTSHQGTGTSTRRWQRLAAVTLGVTMLSGFFVLSEDNSAESRPATSVVETVGSLFGTTTSVR